MKKILMYMIFVTACIALTACGRKDTEKEEQTTGRPEDFEVIAIHAGNLPVYLDEAKYYAYTAQATYETYYLTQNLEIDWKDEMTGGSTWETVVKGQVLDEICKRECMYSLAGQYNVSLTEEEKNEIKKEVSLYFSDSDEKLLKKINISKERLENVFQKKKTAEKVEAVMEAMSAKESGDATQNKKSKEVYSEWKQENTVMATEAWQQLRFDEPVFTMEDLTENQQRGEQQ